MLKFLFFDNRDLEQIEGFARRIEAPRKYSGNPLFGQERPWEQNLTMYGSLTRAPESPFQLWYTVIVRPFRMLLAYAESDDGITWRKPELDIHRYEGRKTNIVFADNPHGAAVLFDREEHRKDWKYKMLCGAEPTGQICAYHSSDGIHWEPASTQPVIPTMPDSPMSLLRRGDGTYAVHHRIPGGGRRIGRSESSDFLAWGLGRIILEPGPFDPCQFQMYGMGSTVYGDYEIGTLWNYYTELGDTGSYKMTGSQQTEFVYSRSGLAWHRASPHSMFISRGAANGWDCGNIQCASAPVFLDDEIRYYYMSSPLLHHGRQWEFDPGAFGLGMAATEPDRFVALVAGRVSAQACTRQFRLGSAGIFVNADVEEGGYAKMELLDAQGSPLRGFGMEDCMAITGDSCGHPVRWQGQPDSRSILNRPIRWRLRAQDAKLYSVWMPDGDMEPAFHRFRSIPVGPNMTEPGAYVQDLSKL